MWPCYRSLLGWGECARLPRPADQGSVGVEQQMLGAIGNTNTIEPQEVHDILRNDRRRNVIKQLQNRLEPVSLRVLSERIAEIETGESPPPSDVRASVYNSLHQTHLPKLDEKDIIDYDKDRKTVRLREPAREVDLYMEVVTPYGITWAAYYRTLGVVALFSMLGAVIDLPLVGTVPPELLISGFLVVFMVSTGYQLWNRRWFYFRSLLSEE